MVKTKLSLVLSAVSIIASQSVFAGQISQTLEDGKECINCSTGAVSSMSSNSSKSKKTNNEYSYLPYVQVGGARFFNVSDSKAGVGVDFFVPLWQSPDNLFFTDLRFYDRTGKPFEGNIHLGYRHLSPEKDQLYGIYGAFDRKHSVLGNYFNQLTFGLEYWYKNLFVGGNFYQPIGAHSKNVGTSTSHALQEVQSNLWNIWITKDHLDEKALGGADAEVGYEFIEGLTGYVGGYYFKAKDTASMCGPKAKLAYDWSLGNGKRILGVFDKLGLEAGVQHDKPRGTTGYLSANFRVGLLLNKNSNLQGVSRHMVDLVRRDVDIVSAENAKRTEGPHKIDGKVVDISVIEPGMGIKDLPHARKGNHSVVIFKGNFDKRLHSDLIKHLHGRELVFGNAKLAALAASLPGGKGVLSLIPQISKSATISEELKAQLDQENQNGAGIKFDKNDIEGATKFQESKDDKKGAPDFKESKDDKKGAPDPQKQSDREVFLKKYNDLLGMQGLGLKDEEARIKLIASVEDMRKKYSAGESISSDDRKSLLSQMNYFNLCDKKCKIEDILQLVNPSLG